MDRDALAKALFGKVVSDEMFEQMAARWVSEQLASAPNVATSQPQVEARDHSWELDQSGFG